MDNAMDNLIYVIEQLWIDYSCNKYAPPPGIIDLSDTRLPKGEKK